MSVRSNDGKLRSDLDLWCVGLILVVTFLLYLGSLPKEFTNWDDGEYITSNPLIRSFSWNNLNQIVTKPYFANYAPLTLISYALDYHVWKLRPWGYHFHNVALHLACIVVLFFLLRKLGLPQGVVLATACLFAIHPVNVESVSWASERKNLLATLFFFLSFYHYVNYSRNQTSRSYLMSLLCFLLSLLSKASTIVAPLTFLVYEYCSSNKRVRDLRLYDKLPFIVFAEILGFLSVHAAGAGSALNSYHKGGPLLSLLASGHLFKQYICLLLWPTKLSALIYPSVFPSFGDTRIWVAFSCFLLVTVIVFAKSRNLFFWVSFFVIFLVPVLNIVPLPIMMANRYVYIAQVGIWVVLSSLALKLVSRLHSFKLAKGLAWGGIGAYLLFLNYQTSQTTKVWRNSYSLWSDTIEKNLYDGVAHYNLGLWFHNQKQSNRSGHEYLISLLINPNYHLALTGIGGYYFEKGQIDLALKKFYAAVNAAPDSDITINNLGKVLAEKGDVRRALYMFFRATYINPNNIGAFNNIVVLYLRVNKIDAALEKAQEMIQRFPESSDGYFRLGMCLEARGDLSGALKAWEESKKRVDLENHLGSQIDAAMLSARQKLSLQAQPSLDRHGS